MQKNLIIWLALSFGLVLLFQNSLEKQQAQATTVAYNQFVQQVDDGKIQRVTLQEQDIIAVTDSGQQIRSVLPPSGDDKLVDQLLNNNVLIDAKKPKEPGFLSSLFSMLFPIILLVAIWIFVMRKMGGGGAGGGKVGNPFSFGKSKAKLMSPEEMKITFGDVAGNKEAIGEVKEIVDFLKDPHKYWKIGAKIPHGVLMLGPPGTGKTLLAKAVAGEANVPFYSISGSDFVEMFVGVGASRVRDMFQEARKNAPCIIFVDEIDAMGRARGAGYGGGNDEREQTLNQMLVEMDGFDERDAVIVMAATNRADVLDPALLRPGRFDRQVNVGLPDVKGRTDILKVHLKKKFIADDVDAELIARGTPMFSGADLANLANEAALMAARRGSDIIMMEDFENAKDKIIMGPAKQGHVMKEKEKQNTAYHEAGHAIVGWRLTEENDSHDPVYKVSILPRGRALGVTMYLPEEDKYSMSHDEAISQICSLYGGRIAEEMTLGHGGVTTGASNDIERATEIAYNMVTRWGYSKELGATLYAVKDGGQGFSGNSQRPVSEETRKLIDAEVTRITKECYDKAEKILTENRDKLELMMKALMKYETIDRQQIEEIMNEGKEPHEPQNWHDDDNDDNIGKGTVVKDDDEFGLSLNENDLKPKST